MNTMKMHSLGVNRRLGLFALMLFLCFSGDILAAENPLPRLALCATCHGEKGISPQEIWPSLAGQHESYLLKQLLDYQKGKRTGSNMPALVAGISEDELKALATYFSLQTAPKGKTPKDFLEKGQRLYRGGDYQKHITACIACHGPKGDGNNETGFPYLSGQHAAYTIQQLKAFRDKSRHNDVRGVMEDISARMSDEDIEAVSHYIEGLH